MRVDFRIENVSALSAGSARATFDETGGRIGRAETSAWIIADAERLVSRHHADITFEDGVFYIVVRGANGVYIDNSPQPLGAGQRAALRDSTRIRMGPLMATVALDAADTVAPPVTSPASPLGADDPFGAAPAGTAGTHSELPEELISTQPIDDLVDRGARRGHGRGGRAAGRAGPFGAGIDPEPWNPGGLPEPSGRAGSGSREAEHMPAVKGAYVPPKRPAPAPAAAGGESEGPPQDAGAPDGDADNFLPPDWRDPAPATADPAPQAPVPDVPDLFAALQPEPPAPSETPPVRAVAEDRESGAAPGAGSRDEQLLASFLKGLGVDDLDIDAADAPALMETAGGIVREVVAGMRSAMIARAEVRGEYRVTTTVIRAVNNNPLKFSVTTEDAVSKLMALDPKGYMPPLEAVREVFMDMVEHETATVEGMRGGVTAVLDRIAPATVEARLPERSNIERYLPGKVNSDLWEAYVAAYQRLKQGDGQSFQDVFIAGFVRAYEGVRKRPDDTDG